MLDKKETIENSKKRIQATLALYENKPFQKIFRDCEARGLDPVKILEQAAALIKIKASR